MKELTVEDLCLSAEKYYQEITDPTYLLKKPFHSPEMTPKFLIKIGVLLSGMHLGPSMKVLDFGAGSCWFSRILNQLQCTTISCDPSYTALEIGKRLFREYPVIGGLVSEPEFIVFDGHYIPLNDNSVDRIICFDAFHHIPNQREILTEFLRVLKDGGIAGFHEPGRFHSYSRDAQLEMSNFTVLENNINIDEIIKLAKEVGFSTITVKTFSSQELSYPQCHSSLRRIWTILKNGLFNIATDSIGHNNIFFLFKGEFFTDSRSSSELFSKITTDQAQFHMNPDGIIEIPLTITNTGNAKWLKSNVKELGVVRLGAHLYDERKNLLNLDYLRKDLNKDVFPTEVIQLRVPVTIKKPGRYALVFDMVSEWVTWFEDNGSKPLTVHITVES